MKTRANVAILALLIPLAISAFGVGAAQAQTDVTVDDAKINLGYMNVFNLPADGGAYQWGSGWGIADLTAVYSGDIVTLGPNTIGDPNPYWYIGGGAPGAPGNKIMEANLYAQEDGPLAGQTVTFSGDVIANSLTSAHTVVAFVKDFAPDFSSFVQSTVVLSAPGQFSVSLATINNPARHVQYGFQMVGVNVWATDVGAFGTMIVGPYVVVSDEATDWGSVKALFR